MVMGGRVVGTPPKKLVFSSKGTVFVVFSGTEWFWLRQSSRSLCQMDFSTEAAGGSDTLCGGWE